ncbi:MAG: serine/threonine-protein kinase [Phycisphaerae bacterium]
MTPQQFKRVEDLFHRAKALAADEQRALLEAECGDDPEVRAEVEALLAVSDPNETALAVEKEIAQVWRGDATSASPPVGPSPSQVPTQLSSQQPENADAADEPRPDIPDYEILGPIGAGAFGRVWLARQRLTGAFLAVKTVEKNRLGSVELDGIRAHKQRCAGHPHLLTLEHVGETPDCYYYVMELADDARGSGIHDPAGYTAMTLAEELSRRDHLPVAEAVEIVCQILDGLGHLHEAGLLHRDVKPANVVRCNGRWKLGDLGLITDHGRIATGACTPKYAPPEGVVNRSGDLYCAGRMLRELVTGSPVEQQEPAAQAAIPDDPRWRRVVGVIERACEAQPERRYQTAAEMNDALRRIFAPAATRRRAGVAGVLALAMVIALGAWWSRSNGPVGAVAVSEPRIELRFKQSPSEEQYDILAPRNVPLRTGNLFLVHTALPEPAYVYLYYISGGVPTLLDASEEPTREFYSPALDADREHQKWHTLTPPAGTETLLLLVSDAPVEDLPRLEERLAAARWPELDNASLLRGPARRPLLLASDTDRGVAPHSAVSPLGEYKGLKGDWLSAFRHARILAFPHVEAGP